jgi:hypothetical protein
MRERYFGGPMDAVLQSPCHRRPAFRVALWNPNRCTVTDVVLGRAASPEYDVTRWVVSVQMTENQIWENSDNALSTNCTMTLLLDPNARPIPIDGSTVLDNAPVRIWIGDESVAPEDWVLVFTGVVRGRPSFTSKTRKEDSSQQMTVMLVGREEAYLQTVLTARNYAKGTDVGRCAVETAIEFMGLDRREIKIGSQQYATGFDQNQLVDVEAMKGIFLLLQTVGKKPRFDADGFLVAVDTDLNKAPVRVYADPESTGGSLALRSSRRSVEHRASQSGTQLCNAVKLLGLSNQAENVDGTFNRLAHGEITAGWFTQGVSEDVNFSENAGIDSGGRRARDTVLWKHLDAFGAFFDASIDWTPVIESDGYTCFKGTIHFDTGYAPWVEGALVGTYLGLMAAASWMESSRAAAIAAYPANVLGLQEAANFDIGQMILHAAATAELVAAILAMQSMGHVIWAIWGTPFTVAYKQLCSIAQLDGLAPGQVRQLPDVRNDWLYEEATLIERAKAMLQRELVKGYAEEIELLDDPLLEVDDTIEFADGSRYYVTTIKRTLDRSGAPNCIMTILAWKIK